MLRFGCKHNHFPYKNLQVGRRLVTQSTKRVGSCHLDHDLLRQHSKYYLFSRVFKCQFQSKIIADERLFEIINSLLSSKPVTSRTAIAPEQAHLLRSVGVTQSCIREPYQSPVSRCPIESIATALTQLVPIRRSTTCCNRHAVRSPNTPAIPCG